MIMGTKKCKTKNTNLFSLLLNQNFFFKNKNQKQQKRDLIYSTLNCVYIFPEVHIHELTIKTGWLLCLTIVLFTSYCQEQILTLSINIAIFIDIISTAINNFLPAISKYIIINSNIKTSFPQMKLQKQAADLKNQGDLKIQKLLGKNNNAALSIETVLCMTSLNKLVYICLKLKFLTNLLFQFHITPYCT